MYKRQKQNEDDIDEKQKEDDNERKRNHQYSKEIRSTNELIDEITERTQFEDLKMNAIKCYSSQFYDPESNESETLISKKNFLNTIYNRSLDLGRLIGVEHAEGFTSNKIIGAKSINDLI